MSSSDLPHLPDPAPHLPDAPQVDQLELDLSTVDRVRPSLADPNWEPYEEPVLLSHVTAGRIVAGSRVMLAVWAIAVVIGGVVVRSGLNDGFDDGDAVEVLGWIGVVIIGVVLVAGWWWSDRLTRNIHRLEGRLPSRIRSITAWIAPAAWASLLAVTVLQLEPTELLDIRFFIAAPVFTAAMWRPYSLVRRILASLSRLRSDAFVGTAYVLDLAAISLLWWQLWTWPDFLTESNAGAVDALIGLSAAAAVALAVNQVMWALLLRDVDRAEIHRTLALRTRHDHRQLRLRGIDPMDPEVRWALLRIRQDELERAEAEAREAAVREAAELEAAARGHDTRDLADVVVDPGARALDGGPVLEEVVSGSAVEVVEVDDVASDADLDDLPRLPDAVRHGTGPAPDPTDGLVEQVVRSIDEHVEDPDGATVAELVVDEQVEDEATDTDTDTDSGDLGAATVVEDAVDAEDLTDERSSVAARADTLDDIEIGTDDETLDAEVDDETLDADDLTDERRSVAAPAGTLDDIEIGTDDETLEAETLDADEPDATRREPGDIAARLSGRLRSTEPILPVADDTADDAADDAADDTRDEPEHAEDRVARIASRFDDADGQRPEERRPRPDVAARSTHLHDDEAADPTERLGRLADRLESGPAPEHPERSLISRLEEYGITTSTPDGDPPAPIIESHVETETWIPPRLYLMEFARYLLLAGVLAVVATSAWLVTRTVDAGDRVSLGLISDGDVAYVDLARRATVTAISVLFTLVPMWCAIVALHARRAGMEDTRVGWSAGLGVLALAATLTGILVDGGQRGGISLILTAVALLAALAAAFTVTPVLRWFERRTVSLAVWASGLVFVFATSWMGRMQQPIVADTALEAMTFFAALQAIVAAVTLVVAAVGTSDIEEAIRLRPELAEHREPRSLSG